MLKISSKQGLKAYEKQRSLVTLFLDSGYSSKNIEIVMNARRGFDAHVGKAWHMLIPYKEGGYAVDMPLSTNGYGIDLSRDIIKEHGIGTGELPVMLFENYDGDSDYFYVSLAGMSEDEIVMLIGEIADIVVEEHENGRAAPNEFRFDVVQRVKRHTRIKTAIKLVKRSASTVVAVATSFIG